ncbi:MAG: hypothetical protein IJO76_06370 [Clostridia bacterium]|nr:hypothetical protein [Clostridia bacterium]
MKGGLQRRLKRRRLRSNWRRLVIPGLLVVLLLAEFIRCRPILTAFAESQAVWIATKTTNRVAEQVLLQHADLCGNMVQTQYTDNHLLSSVFVDTAAVNTVRTAITDGVMTELEAYSSITTGIPLGTLFGPDALSGWGPLVRFPMSVTATVLSDVSSSLEAVGMNQSKYRVLVHVDVSLYVVTPSGRSSVGATLSYPLTEAVLLGEVPDNLTEVYGDDQTLLGKIFDYGTVE